MTMHLARADFDREYGRLYSFPQTPRRYQAKPLQLSGDVDRLIFVGATPYPWWHLWVHVAYIVVLLLIVSLALLWSGGWFEVPQ